MKYNYYVAILHSDNSLEYVTRIDNTTKMFFCEKGKPALKFSKTHADDMLYCLVANFRTAVVIKTPNTYTLSNKEAEHDESISK